VKGILFFSSYQRVIAAREVFTRAQQIYIRAHESCRPLLGSLLFLKGKKKRQFSEKKEFFFTCGRSQFSHHRPQLVRLSFMKRENDLDFFFLFWWQLKGKQQRHKADWIHQMMNATFSLDSLLDWVGNFAFRWVAQTPFVFFTYQILFFGFFIYVGKNRIEQVLT
jgi:hypothetical protein